MVVHLTAYVSPGPRLFAACRYKRFCFLFNYLWYSIGRIAMCNLFRSSHVNFRGAQT